MCNCGKANDAAKGKSKEAVGETKITCDAGTKIEVVQVQTTIDAPGNRIYMNDPDHKVLVTALVTFKETTAADGLDCLPKVVFSFADPGNNNTAKADSYEYAPGKSLGKTADPAAVYWEGFAGYAATSADAWHATAAVTTKPVPGKADQVEAKVWFKPSGVGGNDYAVTATVYRPDGTTEIAHGTAPAATIWRKVSFDKIYEMQGETHVSTNAATATISPVYVPAFVDYSAGARIELDATKSVKYIGLWTDAATPQQDWAVVQQKQADETPTAQEITEATYAGADPVAVAKRDAAQTQIIAKAQKWVTRIDGAFNTARNKWVTDAGIPANALVGIRYYHPKYSADGGDGPTGEWKCGGASTPAWLRVTTFSGNYTNVDPDGSWVGGGGSWVGLSHGNGIVTVPKRTNADAAIKQTVRHEAGHATRSFFKREVFGPSLDHSASNAGIMYKSSALGGTTFSDREKKILRGIKP